MPILIAAAAVAVCLLISYITYYMAFYSPHKGQDDIYAFPPDEGYHKNRERSITMIDAMAARPSERVYITARDGVKLAARYYHTADGAPLVICVHGYRATAIRDFCGIAKTNFAMGCNVLLLDQRGMGESGGHTITFGIKERYDCLCWIDYANRRFSSDTPIILQGLSMGAATVLMAAGLPLPPNVRGVLADSPYSSPAAIIKKVCADRGIPPTLAYPFLWLGALLFGGFRLNAESVTAAVARASVPILIVHGEEDTFVPPDMSAEIARANPTIERHTFPDAIHGISYLADTPRYERLVTAFVQAHDLFGRTLQEDEI